MFSFVNIKKVTSLESLVLRQIEQKDLGSQLTLIGKPKIYCLDICWRRSIDQCRLQRNRAQSKPQESE